MIPERDSGRIPPSNAPRRTGTVPPVLRDTARKAEAGTSADARAMSDKDIIIMQDCILIPPQFSEVEFTAAFLRGKRLFLFREKGDIAGTTKSARQECSQASRWLSDGSH